MVVKNKWKQIYTSELLNLSVETMNSIVEDIIDLLWDNSDLSSPYRRIFVISLSCFFKTLSSIYLIWKIERGDSARGNGLLSLFLDHRHI